MDHPALRWLALTALITLVAAGSAALTWVAMSPRPADFALGEEVPAAPVAAVPHATDGVLMVLPIGSAGPLSAGQRVDVRTVDGGPLASAVLVVHADASTVTVEVPPRTADLLDAAALRLVVVAPWRDEP